MSTQFIEKFIDDCELPARCNVKPTKLICDVYNLQSMQDARRLKIHQRDFKLELNLVCVLQKSVRLTNKCAM